MCTNSNMTKATEHFRLGDILICGLHITL